MLKNQEELKVEERYIEVEASWASILDEGVFAGVQALLDEGKASRHSSVAPRRRFYPLSGVLYCGSCFKKMNAESTTKSAEKRYYRYVCNTNDCSVRSVQAGKIEETVIKSISEFAFRPDVLSRIIEETNSRMVAGLPRLQKELKVREQSLRKVSNKIKKLMYSHGEVERDAQLAIADELDQKSKQKAAIESDIVGLKTRITDSTSNKIVAEAVMISLDKFSSSIGVLENYEKKKLLESLVNKIYWDGAKGLRISLYGNSALYDSQKLTGEKKCAERHDWRLVEDLNLRPSG
ncbi:MAG: zinc ribbon domain-containing protein [Candidatus Sabulitectum sp.]|nr:zinc ribbon domain-containing protein [Candidatus Sabulitectum sp.]